MSLWLVLGGSASGKSAFAERLVGTIMRHRTVHYIATMDESLLGPGDEEFLQRIERHQRRRPRDWTVWVEPGDPVARILSLPETAPILWDGVGPVIGRRMPGDGKGLEALSQSLHHLGRRSGDTVVVSEEAGQGLMPASQEERRFVEALGRINQELAENAAGVAVVVAGIPVWIKGTPV